MVRHVFESDSMVPQLKFGSDFFRPARIRIKLQIEAQLLSGMRKVAQPLIRQRQIESRRRVSRVHFQGSFKLPDGVFQRAIACAFHVSNAQIVTDFNRIRLRFLCLFKRQDSLLEILVL